MKTRDGKAVLRSKINWLALLMFLAALRDMQDLLAMLPNQWARIALAVSAVALYILRTYFTGQTAATRQ